ncbi:phosphotransferase [Natronospira proteinivora]|nr:phosphotransferase [Natronospira proteinivora]
MDPVKALRVSANRTRRKAEFEKYVSAVRDDFERMSRERECFDNLRIEPKTGGSANIYTGKVYGCDTLKFLKVVDGSKRAEAKLFEDVEKGNVNPRGQLYSMVVAERVICFEGRIYLFFPCLEDNRLNVDPGGSCRAVPRLVIDAVAEFHSANPYRDNDRVSVPVLDKGRGLKVPALSTLVDVFGGASRASLRSLWERLDVVSRKWSVVSEYLSSLPMVLTHGDFNHWNISIDSDVVSLRDFGRVFYGPVGYELYWLYYYIARGSSGGEAALARYWSELCRSSGLKYDALSFSDVKAATCAAYVEKWAPVNLNVKSTHDLERLTDVVAAAEQLTDQLGESE